MEAGEAKEGTGRKSAPFHRLPGQEIISDNIPGSGRSAGELGPEGLEDRTVAGDRYEAARRPSPLDPFTHKHMLRIHNGMTGARNDVTKIYNRIPLFRAEAGLSRKALADAVGVNPQTIGYLERGDYYPSLELGMKLGRTFGVPVEALFSFTPFEPVASLLQRTREYQ